MQEVVVASSGDRRRQHGSGPPRRIRSTRLTVAELAIQLGRHQNTIRAWVHAGKIPSIRLNGRIEFDRVAIDRWIAANTFAPQDVA